MQGGALARQRAQTAPGIRILTETITSPTLADRFRRSSAGAIRRRSGTSRSRSRHERAGRALAFGGPVAVYHFDKADVVSALDADFLGSGPGSVRYARDFSSRRAG